MFIVSLGYLFSILLPNYIADSTKLVQRYTPAIYEIKTFETSEPVVVEPQPEVVKASEKVILPSIDELKPVNKDFAVIIPRLNLNVQVIDNVDPFSSKDYEKQLNKGIAHAKNTVYPGQTGNIFLFAHSASITDAPKLTNDFFYNLGDVNPNEEVFTVYKGEVRKYSVKKKVVIKPTQTEYLTNKYDSETLTLMTCWPAGDNSGRLIVIAEPVK